MELKRNTLLAKAIEKSINKAIKYDPASSHYLQKLNQTGLNIVSTSPEFNLCIEVVDQWFHVSTNLEHKDENHSKQLQTVTLTGSLASLTQLVNSDPYSLSNSGVEVSGRVNTLMAYQTFFKQLEIDWEEAFIDHFQSVFGHSVGTIMGSQLATFLTGSINWGKHQKNNFEKYFSDYLSEELCVIPNSYEIEEYLNNVDQLRSRHERLNARIQKLKKYFLE